MNDKIKADITKSYGITFDESTPVYGGWLNEKWRIKTHGGEEFLIKQFSSRRYDRKKLEITEASLQKEIFLYNAGVPCPRIFPNNNGNAITILDDETAYMSMSFCKGKIESPETMTDLQMHSLGKTCGLMHTSLAKLPTDRCTFDGEDWLDVLAENYDKCLNEISDNTNDGYKKYVILQKPIIEYLNKNYHNFIKDQPKGWAHRDFAVDNILFEDDYVSAALDFDTVFYSYINQDIGRAILSFALDEGRLIFSRIDAFIKGYSEYIQIDISDIVNALRLSWCKEVRWWITQRCFEETRSKVVRFRDEMMWLTDNWFNLENNVGK